MKLWYRIVLPYAVCAIAVVDGRVAETAGINRWMMGKRAFEIRPWVEGKGGTIEPLGRITQVRS